MDKETREMFNAVIAAIDKSEEKTNRRFDELEKKMVNMMNEKTQSLYEALHHEINACNLEIGACKSEINVLKSEISACRTEINECKTEINACKAEIGECKTEINACKAEISECKTEINVCKTEIGTCNQKLDSMGVLNGQVKRHESRLTVLEKKVLKTDASERILPWRK